jgi:hypothetical protein
MKVFNAATQGFVNTYRTNQQADFANLSDREKACA